MSHVDRFGNALPFSPLTEAEIDRRERGIPIDVTLAVANGRELALVDAYPFAEMPLRDAAEYAMDARAAGYQRQMGHLPGSAVRR